MTMTAFHGLRRFLVALCAVSIAVVIGSQAIAQSEAPVSAPSDAVEGTDSPTPAEPGVEQLFVLLKDAKTSQDAKGVAGRIAKVWLTSGSDTVDLLMERALIAVHAENYALALDLLDAVVLLKPDYTEGWNKRATVHFLRKDYGRSLADIHETLLREPRHFGAINGLAVILETLDDDAHALSAYRRLVEIYPLHEGARKGIKKLADKVEGRPI